MKYADTLNVIRGRAGFTLMELLIAVSIFSIIALCLYSIFAGGIGIWKRQEKAFRYSHSVRLALDTIGKEMRNVINYSQPKSQSPILEEGQEAFRFSGDEKKLTFITVIGEKIAKIDYHFETTPDKKGILKRRIVFQEEGFKEENLKEAVFIEGLENLTFEYAAKVDKKDAEPVWEKSWAIDSKEEKPKIPLGVRITLEFQEADGSQKEILKKTVFMPTGALEEQAR